MSLTDTKLRSLKPKSARYEVADKGGMFVEVMPSGIIAFRYRYWLHGRKEKVTIGSYPEKSLKDARRIHDSYRSLVESGQSPAREKQAEKQAILSAESFEDFAESWLKDNGHGERWQATQKYWLKLDVYPAIGNRKLTDITAADVLALLDSIKRRGSPQSALRVRGIIKQVFDYGIGRQRATFNPAAQIPSRIVHKPQSRERTLSEVEIQEFLSAVESCQAEKANKAALRLILMTMVRKGELRFAKWEHVDLDRAEWLIPETKNGKPHIVYLSTQALAIFDELKKLAGASDWVLPSTFDPGKPSGQTTLNSVLYGIELTTLRAGKKWTRFTPHDLRRTASTLLHEQGFNSDVI
jgi:integrase